MPRVPFETLPGSSRVWVFASSHPLSDAGAQQLLDEVDRYLDAWTAHGVPLRSARDWREHRFLTIAVDEAATGASGCSIDGLYRTLQALERSLGTSLVAGGRVFYRDASGSVVSTTRDAFAELGATGDVGKSTRVFDPSVTTLDDWRERFELDAEQSWHAGVLGVL